MLQCFGTVHFCRCLMAARSTSALQRAVHRCASVAGGSRPRERRESCERYPAPRPLRCSASRYVASSTLMTGRALPTGGPGGFLCFHDVGEADAVVLGPDGAEPMMDIAPEHE